MITLLILIADMWYYMFTGNSFLYYGPQGIMICVYIFVGTLFLMAEYLTLMQIADSAAAKRAALDHQRNLNELNTKNLWGEK